MFKNVGSLIKLSPKYQKSQGALSAIAVRQIARECLIRMSRDYPEEVAKKIKVTTYSRGVLTVVAPPVVSSDLYMRSGDLVDIINKKAGGKILRRVLFKAG